LTKRIIVLGGTAAALAWLAAAALATPAKERVIEEVDSVGAFNVDRLKSSIIIFNDQTRTANTDPSALASGLISFDDWSRKQPDEKQLLSLYPDYVEPEIKAAGGTGRNAPTATVTMYVAKARFTLDRSVTRESLSRYTSLKFIEQVDPAIKHKLIAPAEVALADPKAAHNRNPSRPWCVGTGVVCFRSHYKLEGKLPLGVQLANKVREANKKIADFLEFESELAVRAPEEFDQARVKRLTKLDTPIVAVMEQSTFHVNQLLQFARSIIVFQQHPAGAGRTVVTAFMAIAIESRLLHNKKEYAKVPVLRNLVPVQVLMGKSSFNSGASVSAGLPNYARSRIRAIARILDGG
jgi:hypothetical protein